MTESRRPDDPTRRHAPDQGRPPLPPQDSVAPADRPPGPPHELDADPLDTRPFVFDNIAWIARVSGKAAGGTGGYGLGLLDAVHFARADEPERPRYEALLARGRFLHLFDDELCALLRGAVRIILPEAESPHERR